MSSFCIKVNSIRLCDPTKPWFFCAYANTYAQIGSESFTVSAMIPVTLVKLAESLYRDFESDPNPSASHRLLCTDGIAYPSDSPSGIGGIWSHTSLVQSDDPDFSVKYLENGIVEITSLAQTSVRITENEYRNGIISYIDRCKSLLCDTEFEPQPEDQDRVDAVWTCIDQIINTGQPPAGFQDWNFGWYVES